MPVMLCASSIKFTFMHLTAISTHYDSGDLVHAAVGIDMGWEERCCKTIPVSLLDFFLVSILFNTKNAVIVHICPHNVARPPL